MESTTVLIAFGLTVVAGLSTGIGSAMALLCKRTNTRFLSAALGFSAGVMIYVSFVEILGKARESLIEIWGVRTGNWLTLAAFFSGILLIAVIDRLVPNVENPHEVHRVEEIKTDSPKRREDPRLMRMGLMTALAIAIHNFPEGIATFTSALSDLSLGIAITFAIAIHNIPEGIAVSVPIYFATGNRRKAFRLSFLSGLAEPLGAVVGYILFLTFFSDTIFGFLFAAVAGIMVFISLDELLPAAREYGEHHVAIYGLVAGMAVMAMSLQLFL